MEEVMLKEIWLRFLELEQWVHLAFGVFWAVMLAGLLLCATRGKSLPRETVAWRSPDDDSSPRLGQCKVFR